MKNEELKPIATLDGDILVTRTPQPDLIDRTPIQDLDEQEQVIIDRIANIEAQKNREIADMKLELESIQAKKKLVADLKSETGDIDMPQKDDLSV